MTMDIKRYPEFVAAGTHTKDDRDLFVLGPLGLAGEAGEVVDLLKKHLIHGKYLDRDRLVEEMGDVLWYFTLICNTHGLSLDEIVEYNVRKLCDRYPDWYGTPSRWLDFPPWPARPGLPAGGADRASEPIASAVDSMAERRVPRYDPNSVGPTYHVPRPKTPREVA